MGALFGFYCVREAAAFMIESQFFQGFTLAGDYRTESWRGLASIWCLCLHHLGLLRTYSSADEWMSHLTTGHHIQFSPNSSVSRTAALRISTNCVGIRRPWTPESDRRARVPSIACSFGVLVWLAACRFPSNVSVSNLMRLWGLDLPQSGVKKSLITLIGRYSNNRPPPLEHGYRHTALCHILTYDIYSD